MTMPSFVTFGSDSGNNVSSLDVSITVQSQTDSVLIAETYGYQGGEIAVSSVVFDPGGGDEQDFTYETYITNSSYNYIRQETWFLINPPVGTYTVTITFASTVGRGLAAVLQYKDAHQTDPIGATGTATGYGTTFSVDVTTTTANSLVVGGIADLYGTTKTPGSGDTERVDIFQSGAAEWVGDTPATTTSTYTVSCIAGAEDYFAAVGIELLEAGGAPPAAAAKLLAMMGVG